MFNKNVCMVLGKLVESSVESITRTESAAIRKLIVKIVKLTNDYICFSPKILTLKIYGMTFINYYRLFPAFDLIAYR